jgi:hypothetical protein
MNCLESDGWKGRAQAVLGEMIDQVLISSVTMQHEWQSAFPSARPKFPPISLFCSSQTHNREDRTKSILSGLFAAISFIGSDTPHTNRTGWRRVHSVLDPQSVVEPQRVGTVDQARVQKAADTKSPKRSKVANQLTVMDPNPNLGSIRKRIREEIQEKRFHFLESWR